MKNILTTLREGKWTSTAIVIMPIRTPQYWLGLPMYADMYIRPAYELVFDHEGLIEFITYFLLEYSESNDEFKQLAIESVVFPLYNQLTGRNFDSNLIAF